MNIKPLVIALSCAVTMLFSSCEFMIDALIAWDWDDDHHHHTPPPPPKPVPPPAPKPAPKPRPHVKPAPKPKHHAKNKKHHTHGTIKTAPNPRHSH